MSDTSKDGGDISSGFGESRVDGPVSDEQAERMKRHADNQGRPDDDTGNDGDADGESPGEPNEPRATER